MHKILISLAALFFATTGFSQQTSVEINALKKTIKKGVPNERYEDKKVIKSQVNYINACDKLGDYYKKLHHYKTALYYYLLADDLSEFGSGCASPCVNEFPIKLRDKVLLKAGDLYYSRRSTIKDLDTAFYYHLRGLLMNNFDKADKYSLLYFTNADPFFIMEPLNTNNTLIRWAINPFNMQKRSKSSTLTKYFEEVVAYLNTDTSKKIIINFNNADNRVLARSMLGQLQSHRCYDHIKEWLTKNIVNPDRINATYDDMPVCTYKSYSLPCIQITVKPK